MGYYYGVEIHGGVFPADKIAGALLAAQQLMTTVGTQGGGSTYSPDQGTTRHYSWVSTERCLAAFRLEELAARPAVALRAFLREWRYSSTVNADGSLTVDYFEAEKLGDEEQMWDALAPFMEATVLRCTGEEGAMWLWCIGDGRLVTADVDISWPGAPQWALDMV